MRRLHWILLVIAMLLLAGAAYLAFANYTVGLGINETTETHCESAVSFVFGTPKVEPGTSGTDVQNLGPACTSVARYRFGMSVAFAVLAFGLIGFVVMDRRRDTPTEPGL